MKKYEDKGTAKLIKDMAFRLFVEKGYEATNLREIGSEVGINASTIYFYYKSKRELFMDVLCHSLDIHIRELEKRAKVIFEGEFENKLKELFMSEIEMVHLDAASYLFVLRYRMFPVAELMAETREVCNRYDEREFQIWKPFLALYEEYNLRELFTGIMKLVTGIINEMLMSGEAIKRQTLEKLWVYCEDYFLDKKENYSR